MPRLLRRNLRCHYCNTSSRNEKGGIPKTWHCLHCDAVNFLDARGNITDPPHEATAAAYTAQPLQYAHPRSRSPTPTMSFPSPSDSLFCDTCERNQLIVNNTMAEYIPDEDDPQYSKYVDSAEGYRAELEDRYPQVCEGCIDRVQDRIRAAGYAAKADHLRRVLEQSKKYQTPETTPRQVFTLALIGLAKWTYLLSVFVGLLWHTLGTLAVYNHRLYDFDLNICAKQAWIERSIDEVCFNAPWILQLVKYALIVDLLTIWWNPKLKQKTNRSGGRMRGLFIVWTIRLAVLAFRCFSFAFFRNIDDTRAEWSNQTHGILFGILLLSTVLAWNSVRITYHSTRPLLQPLDAHLPSAPHSTEKQRPTPHAISRPINSSFDTMAQSFTSSFTGGPSSAYPPSPTLTATSDDTVDSEWTTPYSAPRKSSHANAVNDTDMDWTPTQRRFGNQNTPIIPLSFGPNRHQNQRQPAPAPPNPQPHSPHSIFARPDPNPFRHAVPAAPRGSIAPKPAQINPWNAPGTTQVPPNFFKEAKKFGEASQRDKDWSVPRNVKRQAELFGSPKLKFDTDAYGRRREDTGLEQGFGDLFSK